MRRAIDEDQVKLGKICTPESSHLHLHLNLRRNMANGEEAGIAKKLLPLRRLTKRALKGHSRGRLTQTVP